MWIQRLRIVIRDGLFLFIQQVEPLVSLAVTRYIPNTSYITPIPLFPSQDDKTVKLIFFFFTYIPTSVFLTVWKLNEDQWGFPGNGYIWIWGFIFFSVPRIFSYIVTLIIMIGTVKWSGLNIPEDRWSGMLCNFILQSCPEKCSLGMNVQFYRSRHEAWSRAHGLISSLWHQTESILTSHVLVVKVSNRPACPGLRGSWDTALLEFIPGQSPASWDGWSPPTVEVNLSLHRETYRWEVLYIGLLCAWRCQRRRQRYKWAMRKKK